MRVPAAGTGRALRAGAPVAARHAGPARRAQHRVRGRRRPGHRAQPERRRQRPVRGRQPRRETAGGRAVHPPARRPGLRRPGAHPQRRRLQRPAQHPGRVASVLAAVQAACGSVLARAGSTRERAARTAAAGPGGGPRGRGAAGARAAERCRPDVANTPYTPGHGFGLSACEVPAGGKLSHGFQQAAHACQQAGSPRRSALRPCPAWAGRLTCGPGSRQRARASVDGGRHCWPPGVSWWPGRGRRPIVALPGKGAAAGPSPAAASPGGSRRRHRAGGPHRPGQHGPGRRVARVRGLVHRPDQMQGTAYTALPPPGTGGAPRATGCTRWTGARSSCSTGPGPSGGTCSWG